ncbi:4Fe-4S binding protein [Thioalkalivibrio sp. XN8]|uniref:4Fe-4S binding protein n=1 Tax=Thioalkalivibrio sp. XN8 TaxID=2712863 RepID=UPI0013E9D68A|nr:4Fe-4S binding protein [Thioalkalivibrio sp. XN8]
MTLELPATTEAGRARAQVLAQPALIEGAPTSIVTYQSSGRLVIIGEEEAALAAARRLGAAVPSTLLVPGDTAPEPSKVDEFVVVRGGRPSVEGRLGRFLVNLATGDDTVSLAEAAGAATPHFDLVLDLCDPPLLPHEVPPVGYYAGGGSEGALERALAEIPEMRGEFEKPKYFNYDPSICAHGNSGLKGCTRCIDACPTIAITSIGEKVSVDPYLCQGAGSCVAACPSGAMSYAFPAVNDLLGHLKQLLAGFAAAGGSDPVLLLHDAWSRDALENRLGPAMPENILPVEIEEIGSLGLDAWLATLAYGARAVVIAVTRGAPARMVGELRTQVGFGRALLEGMGYAPASLTVIDTAAAEADPEAWWQALPERAVCKPAKFACPDDKRGILRLVIEHLYRHAPSPRKTVDLPAGAPFGEIRVDRDACTLCMSCASVCPVAAINAGGDLPQLKFTEWNCVQCGLCEKACPEDAITLKPRFLFDAELRQQPRVLHEEQPFCCISCGKPFATQSILDNMLKKLEGHWMFQDEASKRRLQMCDHCRVKDMFKSGRQGGGPPMA